MFQVVTEGWRDLNGMNIGTTNGRICDVYEQATNLPLMALGGFGSADPAPTLQQFQDMSPMVACTTTSSRPGLACPSS